MPGVVASLTDSHAVCRLDERRRNQFGAPEVLMRRDGALLMVLCNRAVADRGY
jgi:hypothetical protein